MALRNLLHGNKFSFEDIEIKSSLTLQEDNYKITHQLNPATGDYKIKDKNANDLIAFDSSARLKSSALNSHIEARLNPINTTITSHETRLTAVEQSGGLVPVGISDVLDVNNNANNRSITGLNDISATSLHVGTSYVVGNSLFAETVYGNNISTMQNQINSLITYNNNLKELVSALASSLDLRDANGNILDVSNLL